MKDDGDGAGAAPYFFSRPFLNPVPQKPMVQRTEGPELRDYREAVDPQSATKTGILPLRHQTSMKIGKKPKPESPEEMALVHHALESPIRRRMIILMVEGCLSVEGISGAIGPKMLGYHLHRLELAGLIEVSDGTIALTEAGEAYGALVKAQAERGGAE